jgi:hypothetical protein
MAVSCPTDELHHLLGSDCRNDGLMNSLNDFLAGRPGESFTSWLLKEIQ